MKLTVLQSAAPTPGVQRETQVPSLEVDCTSSNEATRVHDARRNSPDETVVQASTCARGGSDRERSGGGYPGHGARDHAHLSQRRVHLPSDRVLQRAVAHLVIVALAKAVAHRAAQ